MLKDWKSTEINSYNFHEWDFIFKREEKKSANGRKSQILCHEFIVPNWIHKSLNADIFIFFFIIFLFNFCFPFFSTWTFSFLEYDEVNHFSLGREWKDIASHIASYYDFYMLHLNGMAVRGNKNLFSHMLFFCYIFWFHFFFLFLSSHLSHSLSRPIVYHLKVSSSIYWMNEEDWEKLLKQLCVIFCGITMETKRHKKEKNK